MTEINVGLIGYGMASRVFHAPFITTTSGLKLTKVFERQNSASKEDYPFVEIVRDTDQFLKILTISAYIPMTEQTFTQIYKQEEREVDVGKLSTEVSNLSFQIKEEIKSAKENDDWETQRELTALEKEAEDLFDASSALAPDDTSDARYQIEDKKRKIAQAVDDVTKDKRLAKAKAEYFDEKERCQQIVVAEGTEEEQQALYEAIAQEPVFLNSTNTQKIEERTALLRRLRFRVLWRNPDFLLDNFAWLEDISHTLKNPETAAGLIYSGKQARENKNWERLSQVIFDLLDLVPEDEQVKHSGIVGIS